MLMQLCTSIEGPDKASCLQTEWRSAPVLLLCSCPFEVSFSFFFFLPFLSFLWLMSEPGCSVYVGVITENCVEISRLFPSSSLPPLMQR